MSYRGRIITLISVLFINSLYIYYYYLRDGEVSLLEIFGLPLMLILAWLFGEQYDRVQFLSEKDVLTKAYNRRYLENACRKLLHKTDKNREKIALCVIDIDNFKMINDVYGHQVGDRVLSGVTEVLNKSLGKEDILARWGGDEFIILTPNVDNMMVNETVDRIRKRLEGIDLNILDLSLSIGLAIFPDEGNSLDDLIRVADKKMYEMKTNKEGIL